MSIVQASGGTRPRPASSMWSSTKHLLAESHRIDVPRLESFIHYQMIQAAIVFHRVCLDLYSPEPAIPTILNQ